ncbi:MAG: hypothetical protein ACKOCD_01500 [Nitrospiraceae bacterium]
MLLRFFSLCLLLVSLFPAVAQGQGQGQGQDQAEHTSSLAGVAVLPTADPKKETYDIPEQLKRALPTLYERQGDYTIVPLPAFAYNRNEGTYIGALVPVLKSNAHDEVASILAPQYLYNRYVGSSLTLNYYAYPTQSSQFYAVASQAERVAQNFDLFYKDMGAGGGAILSGGKSISLKTLSSGSSASATRPHSPMSPTTPTENFSQRARLA